MDETDNDPGVAGEVPRTTRSLVALLLLGLTIVVVDGFDIQSIGFAAPSISREFGFSAPQLGPIFSAGLAGAILGAVLSALLSGRVSRRTMLTSSLVVIAFFSLVTTQCADITQFMLVRFVTNIGLGAAVPSVMALCCELAPNRRRALVVGVLWAGSPLGGFVAGLISAHLIPAFGWRSIFYLGSIMPLLLGAVVYWGLSQADGGKTVSASVRLVPVGEDVTAVAAPSQKSASILDLLRGGRAPLTLLSLLPFALMPLLMPLLSFWMPTLLEHGGMPGSRAAIVTACFNFGAVIGGVAGGLLLDRVGPRMVLPVAAILGVICSWQFGFATGAPLLLPVLSALSGTFLACTNAGLLGLPTKIYPPHLGPTGVTAAFAVAKLGQFVGPLIVSGLLTLGMPEIHVFTLTLVPGIVAAVTLMGVFWLARRQVGTPMSA